MNWLVFVLSWELHNLIVYEVKQKARIYFKEKNIPGSM